jgi:hypothetical protein
MVTVGAADDTVGPEEDGAFDGLVAAGAAVVGDAWAETVGATAIVAGGAGFDDVVVPGGTGAADGVMPGLA